MREWVGRNSTKRLTEEKGCSKGRRWTELRGYEFNGGSYETKNRRVPSTMRTKFKIRRKWVATSEQCTAVERRKESGNPE